jgi:hypothetical protein
MAYRFLVICPLLYVGAIAARARLHVDGHSFVACTQKQNRAIAAYREPFIAAEAMKGVRFKDINRDRLREVAEMWILGAAEGHLQPLTPVHLDDFVRDGVKQQIYRANDLLVQLLINTARTETDKPALAARDLIRAIMVADVLKYSDPYAIAQSGIHQRTALQELRKITPNLKPAEKLWIRDQLRIVQANEPSLEPMVRLLYRLYKESSLYVADSSSLSKVQRMLRDQNTADRDSLAVLASLPRPSFSENKSETPVIGLLRMSGLSQSNWRKCLDNEIRLLGETSVVSDPKEHRVVAATP